MKSAAPALIALLTLSLSVGTAQAQTKVANYAYGQPGTRDYEHLSFRVQDGQRADMRYVYGKDRKEAQLTYAGLDRVNGKPCFKVQFANKHTLYLIPFGTNLRVTDDKLAAQKTYSWEYEGPVNGVGTACTECAADEKEALQLVQTHYLK